MSFDIYFLLFILLISYFSVRKAGVPAKIRAENLLNTNLQHYHYTSLLGCGFTNKINWP
jgi:hypothetical protein